MHPLFTMHACILELCLLKMNGSLWRHPRCVVSPASHDQEIPALYACVMLVLMMYASQAQLRRSLFSPQLDGCICWIRTRVSHIGPSRHYREAGSLVNCCGMRFHEYTPNRPRLMPSPQLPGEAGRSLCPSRAPFEVSTNALLSDACCRYLSFP